jgi:SAM-dependent methyltransferase
MWRPLEPIYFLLKTLLSLGGTSERECPNCGYRGKFGAFGLPLRFDAQCPRCRSQERHRLLALWLRDNRQLLSGKSILHFAPEPSVVKLLSALSPQYQTADIVPGRAMTCLNIEQIALPDACVDCVVAFEVLEHVADLKALREIHRVLRQGGMALLTVPIIEGWERTYENPLVRTNKERTLHFGQSDHVRYYGRDFRDRVTGTGFSLSEFTAVEPERMRYSLARGEKIFIAVKGLC